MSQSLPQDKMPEAEVSLRLAMGLISSGAAVGIVQVALDGAQIKTGNTVHFPICEFLEAHGWVVQEDMDGWRGTYRSPFHKTGFRVHSTAGLGDVVAPLNNGRTLRVEAKKGTLVRSKSSSEYRLMREALGQLLTVEEVGDGDILAIAVPSSDKFEQLASEWRLRPLMVKSGVHIATVNRRNEILGLEDAGV